VKRSTTILVCLSLLLSATMASASSVYGFLAGGIRWDAAPRFEQGYERSLDGGLRYSVQTGSLSSYRDLFTWSRVPTVAQFELAVQKAFVAWTIVDPVSGLGSGLQFVYDPTTMVMGIPGVGADFRGAEIDLFGADIGVGGGRGDIAFGGGGVTLTSGTTNYGVASIVGADITMTTNPSNVWTADSFQAVLTHEIGHALGFLDVDVVGPSGNFFDDNYDGTSSATALATLTNSWAGLVNPFDPLASPLSLFVVANGDPGADTFGVDILMETAIPGSVIGNDFPLSNDDFGGRQFLYPYVAAVPIPSAVWLFGSALGLLGWMRRKAS
jgi:hypothetical protein